MEASGLQVTLSMDRMFRWEEFRCYRDVSPFTVQDIRDVAAEIKSWDKPAIVTACLAFNKFTDCGFFEDILSRIELQRLKRAREKQQNSDRARTLRATGRPADAPQSGAVPVQQVLAKLDVAEHLSNFKKQMGWE
jgi:hypothetical protein